MSSGKQGSNTYFATHPRCSGTQTVWDTLLKVTRMAGKSNDYRRFIFDIVPNGAICAEIGVYRGDFSRKILAFAKPEQLHLIDPWKFEPSPKYRASLYGGTTGKDQAAMDAIYQSVIRRFDEEIRWGRVKIHRMPSSDACKEFRPGFFKWVYIDGNHTYDYVKQDLEGFTPLVEVGGLLIGDDYGNKGWWDDGVTKAVSEFVTTGKCKVVVMKNHQFVLQKVIPGSQPDLSAEDLSSAQSERQQVQSASSSLLHSQNWMLNDSHSC